MIHYSTIQYQKELKNSTRNWIKDHYIEKFEDLTPQNQEAIQQIQQDNNCCGLSSYLDYLQKKPNQLIPSSCCSKYQKRHKVTVGQCSIDELKGVKGCGDLFANWLLKRQEDQLYSQMTFSEKVSFLYGKVATWLYYVLDCSAIVLSATLITSIVQSRKAQQALEFELRDSQAF